mmetsp:Transcript_49277/g.67058  ORF Transcript_49277/g.67058 Transcript_49277/m.67058 type:complete len:92 (+) Transcript_49277:150-425(+)
MPVAARCAPLAGRASREEGPPCPHGAPPHRPPGCQAVRQVNDSHGTIESSLPTLCQCALRAEEFPRGLPAAVCTNSTVPTHPSLLDNDREL